MQRTEGEISEPMQNEKLLSVLYITHLSLNCNEFFGKRSTSAEIVTTSPDHTFVIYIHFFQKNNFEFDLDLRKCWLYYLLIFSIVK